MAFVWASVSSGKIAETTHINEAKDNVDTLADNLGVSQYSWSKMPVSQDEAVDQTQIQELQDATDYIDSVNICSSENAGYDGTVEVGDDSSVDSAADTSANPDYDATIDNVKYVSVDTSQDSGIDSTKNNTINSDQNTTVDNDQHGAYNGTLYTTDNPTYNSTVNGSYLTFYNPGGGSG
jgi:hypothetical protein